EAWRGGPIELVSLAGGPAAPGRGGGRAQMRTLLAGVPQDRLLLMTTADPTDPARRLYASEGWHVVGPGIGEGKVILGRRVTPGTSEAEPPVEQVDDRPRPV
ncbi:MAG: hypothetical protein ACTHKG_09655, partial [Nocardioides sp.]